MIRAYPGDPGDSANSARAWQDVLVRRGALRTSNGLLDSETKAALEALRDELGLGSKSRWTTVWAHAQGLKAADVASSEPDVALPEDEGAPPA